MEVVSHNVEAMRAWSGNINTASSDYSDYIKNLYTLVDNLVSSDFTGGLSQDFENLVLDKKDDFMRYSEVLEECAELIDKTSTNIENDEEELRSRIQNHDVFNDKMNV